jgi:phosphoribosylamine--glycine ligase
MRVLVLGSGAKDHAVAYWFSKSSYLNALFCAPGNLGTSNIAENLSDVDPANAEQVYQACIEHNINFVFIGTEAPLFTGVIDYLNERGIATFGAPVRALKLEGDRNFARNFTNRHNIPTPGRNLFTSIEDLESFLLRHRGEPFVLKSNTITPSRIMLDSSDTDALLNYANSLFLRGPVLLEEHCDGTSITCSILLDKNGYIILPYTSDYTRTGMADKMPTGGMGSVCPVPLSAETIENIKSQIIEPTLYGLKVEQLSYKGVLTFSLIIKPDKNPILVDYHIRFNDPATQAMVPLIKTDLIKILWAMKEDKINTITLETTSESTVAVVIASEGYPVAPQIGKTVENLPMLMENNYCSDLPLLFCGATRKSEEGSPVTTGGRCFTVVGKAHNIITANKNAYSAVPLITFEGAWYRKDIGEKFFEKNLPSPDFVE